MPMIQNINQLDLGAQVRILSEAVLACRARAAQVAAEEAEFLDQLAQAEAQVLGGKPDNEGEPIEVSGLIAHGENPYYHAPHADR